MLKQSVEIKVKTTLNFVKTFHIIKKINKKNSHTYISEFYFDIEGLIIIDINTLGAKFWATYHVFSSIFDLLSASLHVT